MNKIIVGLEREDIINMIRGTSPSYKMMSDPLVNKLGDYTGGFHDRWDWGRYFPLAISNEKLLELYYRIKEDSL